MAENFIDILYPYIGDGNDINYWDAIKLTDKYSNIDKNIYETTEEFWNIMPHYMLHLIMSSHPESRVLYDKPRCVSLSKMPRQLIQSDEWHPLLETEEKEIHTNPMDVFIYVFRKASPLMRQIIVNQVNKCQLSLPLIIQDPIFHKPLMFPFAYQNLTISCFTSEGKLRSFHVAEEKLNIISFIRIGKSKKSFKSKLMNNLFGFNHSCFFNRGCSGSSKTRLLYDGTIEMNWYLPGGPNDKLFEDPLTFLNLRGNSFEFKTQLTFICEISTMVGIILTSKKINEVEIQELGTITTKYYDKICLIFTEKAKNAQKFNKILKFCNSLPNFSPSDRNVIITGNLEEKVNPVRISIKGAQRVSSLKLSITNFKLICKDKGLDILFEDVFVELGIENCISRMNAFNYIYLSTDLKQLSPEEYLPLQHEGWKKYAQADRKQHKHRNEKDIFNKAKFIYVIKFELTAARNLQFATMTRNQNHCIALKDFSVIIHNSKNYVDVLKMLTLFRIDLERWKLACSGSKTINIQYFIRELGQYYEMCHDIGKDKALNSIRPDIDIDHKLLPQLFARLMLLGEPLEIFDGEAQHIPLTWVQDVLSALAGEIGRDKKVFVLGVLGIQSSGKSTLLNTMFGLQFPVASGRCTRGVSMQLISVDNEYAHVLNYDYLVILDSQGLRSIEDSNQYLKSSDNEFTTLMIGISDLCIINIMGENFMEWQDIFQTIIIALMKLTSSTKSKPKCLLVHQNISDPNARENLKESYQKFLLKLDGVTQFISTETKSNPIYTKFTDIIYFDINESIYFLSSLYSTPPPMSIVSKNYVNSVQSFKKDVISKYGHKYSSLTLLAWSRKLKTVWKSILNETFVSSYREIIERIYCNEFENALHKWSQNYACEMERNILLCKDQILNANYEYVMQEFASYEADNMVEKCKTILVSDENEFNKYYFVTHSDRLIFNNWKKLSEHHFNNTRLDHQIRSKEKISHFVKLAERNHKLLNDFYGKRDLILEMATKAKLELFKTKYKYKTKFRDQDMFDQIYEVEWQNWTSNLKFLENENPCINFILLLIKEMDTLTSDLHVTNEEMEKTKSFYKLFEENNYCVDVFVIGKNHYRMFEQNGMEIHVAREYYSWLDYVLRKEDKDTKKIIVTEDISFLNIIEQYFSEDYDNCTNSSNYVSVDTTGLEQKLNYLKARIYEACDDYIMEIMNPEFSCEYFAHIIKIILNSVQEFNNKEMNDETLEIRIQIEKVFIYELALFLCAKLILKLINKHKPNQMDSLKTQLKSQFKYYYNKENYSSSLGCANGLANILLEKMNLYVAEEIQFLVIDSFSYSNTFSVSSKCHLQTKVLTDLANESSFAKYCKYLHEPNQAMEDWIIEKFHEFLNFYSSISRINAWYNDSIRKHISIYSEAIKHSLKLTTPVRESTANDVIIENSYVNSDWKAQLHMKLEGNHTREFKLSDLDVLLIEPHEITNPSEFVLFFADSLQKQSDSYNFKSWIETYLMADIIAIFSVTICQNLFYCNEHCPLCNEPCLSNINSSEHKHYCGSFHRPLGLNGWFKLDSEEFIGYDCTNLKDKDEITYMHKKLKFEICKQMSESWDNSGKHYMIESVYWEWVMCNFKDELADHYQYKINDKAIQAWSNLTKSQVLNDLQLQMNDFHSPAFMWRTKKKIKHFFTPHNY